MAIKMELNYAKYLELEALLKLQHPRGEPAEHDEMLFIIIHQVYELWFKQVLHEVDKLKRELTAGELFPGLATLKRVRMIIKTLVSQLDILETMTPMSFHAFRERLDTASGFQSVQFRELECVLGIKRPDMLKHLDPAWPGYAQVMARFNEASLIDHFYDFLEHRGATIPTALREKPHSEPTRADAEIQAQLLHMYRSQPDAVLLFEQMMDVDEGLQEWRYRHLKIVERTIGRKRGTGGSAGVEFLRRSLFQPIFPDLWLIRREM